MLKTKITMNRGNVPQRCSRVWPENTLRNCQRGPLSFYLFPTKLCYIDYKCLSKLNRNKNYFIVLFGDFTR